MKKAKVTRHMYLSTILCLILSTLFVAENMNKDILTIIYFHWEVILGTAFGSSIPAIIYLFTRSFKRNPEISIWYVAQNIIVLTVYLGKIGPYGELMQ